jgi:hypothetical protein
LISSASEESWQHIFYSQKHTRGSITGTILSILQVKVSVQIYERHLGSTFMHNVLFWGGGALGSALRASYLLVRRSTTRATLPAKPQLYMEQLVESGDERENKS